MGSIHAVLSVVLGILHFHSGHDSTVNRRDHACKRVVVHVQCIFFCLHGLSNITAGYIDRACIKEDVVH